MQASETGKQGSLLSADQNSLCIPSTRLVFRIDEGYSRIAGSSIAKKSPGRKENARFIISCMGEHAKSESNSGR